MGDTKEYIKGDKHVHEEGGGDVAALRRAAGG